MLDFYGQVLSECEPYFGNKAQQFLDKQIQVHLFKSPHDLSYEDKAEISKWIWTSSALILGREDAKALADRIMAI